MILPKKWLNSKKLVSVRETADNDSGHLSIFSTAPVPVLGGGIIPIVAANGAKEKKDEIKVLTVFRHGDLHHRGARLAVSKRHLQSLAQLLRSVGEAVPVVGGPRRLYTTDGHPITDISEVFNQDMKEIIVLGVNDRLDLIRTTQQLVENRRLPVGHPNLPHATKPFVPSSMPGLDIRVDVGPSNRLSPVCIPSRLRILPPVAGAHVISPASSKVLRPYIFEIKAV